MFAIYFSEFSTSKFLLFVNLRTCDIASPLWLAGDISFVYNYICALWPCLFLNFSGDWIIRFDSLKRLCLENPLSNMVAIVKYGLWWIFLFNIKLMLILQALEGRWGVDVIFNSET